MMRICGTQQSMLGWYQGKIAIVTGAASGIGAALAKLLVREGATVVLCDVNEDAVRNVARSLDPDTVRAIPVCLDVTNCDGFGSVVRSIHQEHGRIDLLFNNAGIGLAGEVQDVTPQDWERIWDVNVRGVVHGIHWVYPIMIRQGRGSIINTASGAGLVPRPGMVPYATTKHAVVGLTISMRPEARHYGVRVSALCPGYVQTNILKSTRYVGVDGHGLTAKIPVAPLSADACAQRCLRGVMRDQAIITDSLYVRIEWLLYRVSPRLAMWLARIRAKVFRRHKRSAPLSDVTTDL